MENKKTLHINGYLHLYDLPTYDIEYLAGLLGENNSYMVYYADENFDPENANDIWMEWDELASHENTIIKIDGPLILH